MDRPHQFQERRVGWASQDVTRAYQKFDIYYGDLHNHCDLSYGHGSLDAALRNAQLQLDFASVTVHAVWPDLPVDDPALEYLVDYHRQGFARAQANWPAYLAAIDAERRGAFRHVRQLRVAFQRLRRLLCLLQTSGRCSDYRRTRSAGAASCAQTGADTGVHDSPSHRL